MFKKNKNLDKSNKVSDDKGVDEPVISESKVDRRTKPRAWRLMLDIEIDYHNGNAVENFIKNQIDKGTALALRPLIFSPSDVVTHFQEQRINEDHTRVLELENLEISDPLKYLDEQVKKKDKKW